MLNEIKVGQKLWYVPIERRHDPFSVMVESIGRKWFSVKADWYSLKINLEDFCADGGKYTSPGKCWLSKESYESEMELRSAWDDFKRRIPHMPPYGISVRGIKDLKWKFGISDDPKA